MYTIVPTWPHSLLKVQLRVKEMKVSSAFIYISIVMLFSVGTQIYTDEKIAQGLQVVCIHVLIHLLNFVN